MNEFGKKLSFSQLYELTKANKQNIHNENIPHATYLCEIYKSAVFLSRVWLRVPKELNIPANPHDIVEKFICDSNDQDRMKSECNNNTS